MYLYTLKLTLMQYRQVANLEADVSNEDGIKDEDATEGGSENSDEILPLQPQESSNSQLPPRPLPIAAASATSAVMTNDMDVHEEDEDEEEDSLPLSRQLTSTTTTTSPVTIPVLASARAESSNPLNSVLTPPNHHRMSPLASEIHHDEPVSAPQDSENREELAQVLNEYEQALSRMMGLFPGLGQEEDEQWRERVQRIRERL